MSARDTPPNCVQMRTLGVQSLCSAFPGYGADGENDRSYGEERPIIRPTAATERRGKRRGRTLSVAAAWLTAGALTAAGCAPSAPVSHAPSGSVTLPSDPATGPLAHRDSTSWTARSMVNALEDAGLAVPDPLDNTATECRDLGCEQSVVTDTLRIKTFPTAEDAARYAAPRGLYRADRIVVAFAPPLTMAERKPYLQTLDRLTK